MAVNTLRTQNLTIESVGSFYLGLLFFLLQRPVPSSRLNISLNFIINDQSNGRNFSKEPAKQKQIRGYSVLG